MIEPTFYLEKIDIKDYNYHLPDKLIAKFPLEERDKSKLLVYKDGKISEQTFLELPSLFSADHLFVFNNTRVIPARLHFRKTTGALIEIFCLEPYEPENYLDAFQSQVCSWKCIVGNLKKWKSGCLTKEIRSGTKHIYLTAELIYKNPSDDNSQIVRFSWNDSEITFGQLIEMVGEIPIPPYLNRESEEIDKERYQTIYSKIKGSVAAPTAGLHFTDKVLHALKLNYVSMANVTLHVGAGTFKPIKSDDIYDHQMHSEFFSVNRETILELQSKHGNIISVGTTTLRTLESLYWIAVKIKSGIFTDQSNLHVDQWDPYKLRSDISYCDAMQILLDYMQQKKMMELKATTRILIMPGYKINSIQALITNFHQPQSTLLLLVSTITGNNWKKIYEYAQNHEFRFLSYGDSSILFC